MFGADVEALEAAAFQLTAAADELDSSAKQLSMALGSLSWLGQVAIRFSDAWSTRHSAEMRLTSSYLRENATKLHDQAGQQRQASMASSSWSVSPTGTNGPGFGQGGKPDLDKMSASQRDAFNRAVLANDLARLLALKEKGRLTDADKRLLVNLEAIQRELDEFDRVPDPITGAPVGGQLYIYEPLAYGGDGRAAVALGNLETADHVAFMVSGMGSKVSGMSGGRSTNVYNESRWASDSGDSVAIVDWVGYDAPSGDIANQVLDVKDRDMAEAGAAVLAEDVARFNRVRAHDAHVTVIGNSYGSTTAAIAADNHGLAVDDLILTGSPGAGGSGDADELSTGRDHTWVGAASKDLVSHLGVTGWTDPTSILTRLSRGHVEVMGNDPSEGEFSANRFQAESVDRQSGLNTDDHGRYYDKNTESLHNVAAIVTGEYDEVSSADHRRDGLRDVGVHDRENDRRPTKVTHHPKMAQ